MINTFARLFGRSTNYEISKPTLFFVQISKFMKKDLNTCRKKTVSRILGEPINLKHTKTKNNK